MLPLLAITAFIRLGKDSMRLYKVSTDIEFHVFANDVLAEQEYLVQDLCRHCLRVYSRDFQSVRDQESLETSFQFS